MPIKLLQCRFANTAVKRRACPNGYICVPPFAFILLRGTTFIHFLVAAHQFPAQKFKEKHGQQPFSRNIELNLHALHAYKIASGSLLCQSHSQSPRVFWSAPRHGLGADQKRRGLTLCKPFDWLRKLDT